MPTSKHVEKHFTAGEVVRDVVIGVADGLTVPFALAAGLSGSLVNSNLIVVAGLAEIVAGAIAMGLGGYLAGKADRDHYLNEKKREIQEVIDRPEQEKHEVEEIFKVYGLQQHHIEPILQKFQTDHEAWVEFMMRFELGIEEPDPKRAAASGLTIAASYALGGLIPLMPYMLNKDVHSGLIMSCLLTALALIIFGYIKGRLTGNKPFLSAVQTLMIGSLAASAAFIVVKLISHS